MVCVMPSLPTPAARACALPCLRDESGIALVMALGIMFVLTIALSAVIVFTSASARHANNSNAGQKAYSLAEAGVNNAIAVLHQSYDPPAAPSWPGCDDGLNPPCTASYLPAGQAAYNGGSCTTPVNNCTTWRGTLAGPFIATPSAPWHYEWRISSTGTVQNPTGPGATPVIRKATAVVPVVIPETSQTGASGPLNFLYAGNDMWFQNSVHVKAPVYVTRDLHLESSAVIDGAGSDGAGNKAAIGRDLYLKNPQNQIGLTGGSDPRISEIHVVHQCSSKNNPTLHNCGTLSDPWDTDKVFATVHDSAIPASFLTYTPQLTCCSPVGGTIAPAPAAGSTSNMGFWYENADLGPWSPCTTGSLPSSVFPNGFDTASAVPDNSINWSATPTTAINLTPPGISYSCKSMAGSTVRGELSWDPSTKLLTVQGTIFIDGSIYISPGGTARYTGLGTIIASGTFGMKNDTICATHPGYTGPCDFTKTSPWDPGKSVLFIVAGGAAGPTGAQGQGSDFNTGESIELKNAGFQGVLIANHAIRNETTTKMQGPMISVNRVPIPGTTDGVFAGQSNDIIFPPVLFAPSGGDTIISDPPVPQLLPPRNFGGG
jgi:hypothetical protein